MLVIINNGKISFSDYLTEINFKEEKATLDDISLDNDMDNDGDFNLDLDDDDDFGIDLDDMEADSVDDDLGSLDDLDEINHAEDLDDIDDLDDLDDLDEINDVEDFDELGTEEEFNGNDEDKSTNSANMDYEIFQAINKMVKKYYHDTRYDNDFIQTVFIANADSVGKELKAYLVDELFVSVVIRNIDVLDELSYLAQREVLNES